MYNLCNVMASWCNFMASLPAWQCLLIALAVVFLWVFPLWRIIGRTGRHPAISLLGFFPPTALIVLWWLAFAKWPKNNMVMSRTGDAGKNG